MTKDMFYDYDEEMWNECWKKELEELAQDKNCVKFFKELEPYAPHTIGYSRFKKAIKGYDGSNGLYQLFVALNINVENVENAMRDGASEKTLRAYAKSVLDGRETRWFHPELDTAVMASHKGEQYEELYCHLVEADVKVCDDTLSHAIYNGSNKPLIYQYLGAFENFYSPFTDQLDRLIEAGANDEVLTALARRFHRGIVRMDDVKEFAIALEHNVSQDNVVFMIETDCRGLIDPGREGLLEGLWDENQLRQVRLAFEHGLTREEVCVIVDDGHMDELYMEVLREALERGVSIAKAKECLSRLKMAGSDTPAHFESMLETA